MIITKFHFWPVYAQIVLRGPTRPALAGIEDVVLDSHVLV